MCWIREAGYPMPPVFRDMGDELTILRVRERRFEVFADRYQAGRIAGEMVAKLPDIADGVVLGLVRGGVPVAFEVAKACRLPLDILLVRKLGVPWQPELAIGAIASGDAIVLNQDLLRSCRISGAQLDQIIQRERAELHRREALYRQGHPSVPIDGRAVILVDDGLATGASMRVAIRAVKEDARRVIVAVPVGARSTVEELSTIADEVVCALVPEPLEAVSQFYRDFQPTSDDELRLLLSQR
jgi:putative phosphoribosyl transferase